MKNFLLLLLFPFIGPSQNVIWSSFPNVTMPFNPDMIGYCVAADADENTYWAGFKSDPFVYQDIMGNQFLEKFDSDGNTVFSKEITGHAQTIDLGVDSNQNIIVLFKFVGNMTIGTEVFETSLQGEQHVIAKFNALGELAWHIWLQPVEMGSGWYNEIAELRALTIDANDNIVIGFSDFFKSFIRKYDAAGNVLMEIEQKGVTRISSVCVDDAGNFYSAGACAGNNSEFAGVSVENSFTYDTYVAKFDASGQFQWVKFAEDVTCSESQVICKTPDEVYFLTPVFVGPLTFEGQTIQGSPGTADFLLAKYNSTGQIQWVKETPGEGGFDFGQRKPLKMDADGNVYITGQAFGETQWAESITTNPGDFMSQGTYVKYSPEGQVINAGTMGGNYARIDNMVISGNRISMTGMASGDLNFGDFNHSNVAGSDYYPFLIQIESESLGAPEADLEKAYVFPNPAKDKIFLTLNVTKTNVSIFNLLGQKVMKGYWEHGVGLDISELASGPYLVKADGFQPIRFIRE